MKSIQAALLAVVLLAGVGCSTAPKTVGGPPVAATSPALQVAYANKTVADAAHEAVVTVITLRDAGQISPADARAVEDYCKVAVEASNAIAGIQLSGDSWTVQKSKILLAIEGVTTSALAAHVGPAAAQAAANLMSLFTQIKGLVQQP